MAAEILAQYQTGQTLYAVVLQQPGGKVWRTDTLVFEAPLAANWTHYAVSLAEQSTTGLYEGNFPAGISAAGIYSVIAYLQAGGSPATTDPPEGEGEVVWSGTAEVQSLVGAYASGQDPATLVLDVAASSHNTAGTVGAKINSGGGGGGSDPLANAVPGSYAAGTAGAALGRIGTAAITTVSPVAPGGLVTLVIGDSYKNADGRALTFTGASSNVWPNLTGATVVFQVLSAAGVPFFSAAGTVVTPTGTQQVYCEPTSAQTALLKPGNGQPYKVLATLSNGDVVTLAEGQANVSY